MLAKRIVVIGGSSGSLEPLTRITAELPADFPAAICVVLHVAPDAPGMLARTLARASVLPAASAATGIRLENGRIYVAPPDHHLVVEPGALRLTRGPRENRFRPAVDPLFRSAAQVFGPAAIGVILSGSLDDGTSGLWAIKRLGGITLVQDPADALYPSMPTSALRHVDVDHRVPRAAMAPLLVRLTAAPADARPLPITSSSLEVEMKIARGENAIDAGVERIGAPSPFACPECHGVLLRLKAAFPLRFRCHTGHAYSVESLAAALNEGIEDALWSAVRSLEEAGLLLQELSAHQAIHAHPEASQPAPLDDPAERAADARRKAERIRELIAARTTEAPTPGSLS